MTKPVLTEKDYKDAAQMLDAEVAAIRAVAEVESAGSGFLQSGEPKILFERHVFSKRTGGLFDASHPNISNSVWGGYGAAANQHKRLQEAAALNREAALMSASWGKFQIMGFNYALCGFNTLQDFVNAMYRSEREHLLAFVNYIKNVSLDDELREHRWADFARKYNGPDYRKNRYDIRLKGAYNKFTDLTG
ncbi:N-acetylmuramidase family protein [Niabella hirudinis]|uniref:N-acetylmuramidase family protein n=1 Tax=Niabella hirudinis TaxID=1285929 RepID=UPI003EBA2F7C